MNQHAGRIIRSIAESGPVIITDHGRPVAKIVEFDEPAATGWEKMVADGRVIPAARTNRFQVPTSAPRSGMTSEQIMDELRGDH